MILDDLKNIKKYKVFSENLAKAIDWLEKTDLDSLKINEKVNIDGESVFAVLDEYETFDPKETKADGTLRKTFEGHKKYADIQIILKGKEVMEHAPLQNDTEILIEYDEDKDIYRANPKNGQDIIVRAGQFIIFYPQDLHKPCMDIAGEKQQVKKMVIKFAI